MDIETVGKLSGQHGRRHVLGDDRSKEHLTHVSRTSQREKGWGEAKSRRQHVAHQEHHALPYATGRCSGMSPLCLSLRHKVRLQGNLGESFFLDSTRRRKINYQCFGWGGYVF